MLSPPHRYLIFSLTILPPLLDPLSIAAVEEPTNQYYAHSDVVAYVVENVCFVRVLGRGEEEEGGGALRACKRVNSAGG